MENSKELQLEKIQEIKQRLRKLIKKKHDSFKEFCDCSNININTLNKWTSLNNDIIFNLDNLYYLADYFDVSTDYLLCIEDYPTTEIKEIEINLENVSKFTGLSVETLSVIKFIDNDNLRALLNYLITTDSENLDKLKRFNAIFDKAIKEKNFDDNYQSERDYITKHFNDIKNANKKANNINCYKDYFLESLIDFVMYKPTEVYREEKDKKTLNPILTFNTTSKHPQRKNITPNFMNEVSLSVLNDYLRILQDNYDKTENPKKANIQDNFRQAYENYCKEKGKEIPKKDIIDELN